MLPAVDTATVLTQRKKKFFSPGSSVADKRKNPLGPTPPRQPGVQRVRSEVHRALSSEASGGRPPRTSTPFESSFTDYRAPREPLSPCIEGEDSDSEEDPFYVPEEDEELGELDELGELGVNLPLPPHNSQVEENVPGLLPPVLQPPPLLPVLQHPLQAPAANNMATAAELTEAERAQRTSIESTVEEVRVKLLAPKQLLTLIQGNVRP